MNLERSIALTPAATVVSAVKPETLTRADDDVSVGYLRAAITVMVVAHHAVLAYHPFVPAPAASLTAGPPWWQAFPVVDSQRWGAFALFTGFNDIFFMALMFFLSGLFVWNSLQRKGSGTFLKDRALRLGLPFVVGAALLAPLAYYPAYLQTGGKGLAGYWTQWRSLENWPAGPAWFLWVLLAFGAVAAGLTRLMPRWGDGLGRLAARVGSRPAAFFGLLAAASAVAYIPMALAFTPIAWTTFGPFAFQTSRPLFYAVYFLAGIAVGAGGLRQGLLAPDGRLARRWLLWLLGALVAFGVAVVLGILIMTSHIGSKPWETAGGFAFVVSSAASSLAFLALFARFAGRRVRALDSLRDNAYGIYLVHYAFVSWLQLSLLGAPLGAPAKGAVVILGALALSWVATHALRRLPGVARVI
ncbi:MAG TPA: acyltransferase [Thermoanaerobaculia bacterium]|jgi:hypothetical protein|nr:acyltransferase [Thermoanaerobaculia bacterium]